MLLMHGCKTVRHSFGYQHLKQKLLSTLENTLLEKRLNITHMVHILSHFMIQRVPQSQVIGVFLKQFEMITSHGVTL